MHAIAYAEHGELLSGLFLQFLRPVQDLLDRAGGLVPFIVAFTVEDVVIMAWNQDAVD